MHVHTSGMLCFGIALRTSVTFGMTRMMLPLLLIVLIFSQTVLGVCETEHCAQCDGDGVCNVCSDGYWLDDKTCQECPSTCAQCTNNTDCISCVVPHWNSVELCNRACPQNCADGGCEDESGLCYACKPGGYGPRCNRRCSWCVDEECDLKKCTKGCKNGYSQHIFSSGYSYCHPCSSHCRTCNSILFCTQCEQGFHPHVHSTGRSGRDTSYCYRCLDECMTCQSVADCPKCHLDCINNGCGTGGCNNTSAVPGTKSPDQPHGEVTMTSSASRMKQEQSYHKGFGEGIGAGLGIALAVGVLIAVAVFVSRRMGWFHAKGQAISTSKSPDKMCLSTQDEIATRDDIVQDQQVAIDLGTRDENNACRM